MPIYKNTKSGPLTVDTAEGEVLSVRGRGSFKVSKATEQSPRFVRLKTLGSVRFVSDDLQPRFVEEVVMSPETASTLEPASDVPGQVPFADESSAIVAPVDVQHPDSLGDFGLSDFEKSGAAEPEPGEGATDDAKSRKRKKRWSRSSNSED